jgi:Holliday junction DNA helicase RuvA
MISYLEGKIILKKDKFVIVNVAGVGYKVFLSANALSMISEIGKDVKLFCFTDVKENAIDIYGFSNPRQLDFFEILDSIRGIGPKAALEISSLGSLEEIKEKVLAKDENLFSKIPGIGRKKAMAIILELTGKIRELAPKSFAAKAAEDEAEEGLVGLGFVRQKAKLALKDVPQNLSSEERIKQALKLLGK